MKERDPNEAFVGLHKVRNGYLVRHDGCTYVFASFDDAVSKVKELFGTPQLEDITLKLKPGDLARPA